MKDEIYLRALELDDYKISIAWRKDDDITDTTGGNKIFVSSENEKQWVQGMILNKEKIVLAICLKSNDKYIGNVSMFDIDLLNKSCSVAIMIGAKEEWNKGYASEALKLMLKYAFEEKGMERVSATILKNNIASIKLHEKCGYKVEGTMRHAIFKLGKYNDLVLLSILKDEFFAIQNV